MAAIISDVDDFMDSTGPVMPLAAPGVRWLQLVFGILCITMVANLQYGWTLFVGPLDAKFHWGRPAIQVAFTLFIIAESWLMPFCGWIVDKKGPRVAIFVAGLMAGACWLINSVATEVWMLWVSMSIGGLGMGIVVACGIGNALKWFPDRRGLASGLTSGAFGVASAITILPLQNFIHASGYEAAFFWFGLVQGVGLLVLSLFIRAPRRGEVKRPQLQRLAQSKINLPPTQILRQPIFWVMYVAFVLVCAGGLIATAQLALIATDLQLQNSPVTLLWITLPALSYALSLDRMLNGITRPLFGFISDRLGRENTMFGAFLLEGFGIWALAQWGTSPVAFVVLSGVVFFAWGEIYSLFPATTTDAFGPKYAAANYGIMFTAKGVASLLVPLANVLMSLTGNWHAVFVVASLMNVAAAFIALLILKPMRRRIAAREGQDMPNSIIEAEASVAVTAPH